MAVGEGSWSAHARRRGQTIARWQVLGGGALLVVLGGAVVADVTPSDPLLVVALAVLVPSQLILEGMRRFKVESSPPLTPPLVLPAASNPGWSARYAEPRPGFGLRLGLRPVRAVVSLGIAVGVPAVVLAVTGTAVAALTYVLAWAAIMAWNLNWWQRHVAAEVRVADARIEWKARRRTEVIPVASLRRLRCNTLPSAAIVLEFEGHRPLLVHVTGGFADFLDALTVTCPWIEVSSDIVERFGSWSGKTNGFFVESLEPGSTRPRPDLLGTVED